MVSLITGASGFIGQHLSAHLQALGHQVLSLPRQWSDLPKFDYLFHLAAYGNKYNQQKEEEIFEANVGKLWKLLVTTKNIKFKAFINFSTSNHILQCDSFYGATKACGENLIRAFVKKYQLPIVSVRPFSVYGPNQSKDQFIPTAIRAFKEGKELILAPGVHDWIYVEDLVKGVIKVAENVEKLKGQSIDIGTGHQNTNYEIIAILREIFMKPGKIKRVEKIREYDTNNLWVADSRILKKLGWSPKYDLEDGLYATVYN